MHSCFCIPRVDQPDRLAVIYHHVCQRVRLLKHDVRFPQSEKPRNTVGGVQLTSSLQQFVMRPLQNVAMKGFWETRSDRTDRNAHTSIRSCVFDIPESEDLLGFKL